MIFGWDIGGAHVKVAVLDEAGRLVRAVQTPCPLWLGLEHLERALRELMASDTAAARHAVTMTGELVDYFPDRAAGVKAIVDAFHRLSDGSDTRVYARDGFLDTPAASAEWHRVASANWLASATVVAAVTPDALVLDVGSTTTDITLIAKGHIATRGHTDHDRLVHEELLYTGVVRTPLMAVAELVPFAGEWVALMAEHFATIGDVYRITADLAPEFDQADTADGGPRSRAASMRRLARMIGCDVAQAPALEWERLAHYLRHAHSERIRRACDRALSRGLVDARAPIVGLGAGHFVAARLAAAMDRPYREFAALLGVPRESWLAVNTCGPAFAVAELRRRMP